jgi:hypothetical protein
LQQRLPLPREVLTVVGASRGGAGTDEVQFGKDRPALGGVEPLVGFPLDFRDPLGVAPGRFFQQLHPARQSV